METFFVILISGMSAGYVVELLAFITQRFLSTKVIRAVLTLPLTYFACWVFGLTGATLIVASLAAAFFALIAVRAVHKPDVVHTQISRRL